MTTVESVKILINGEDNASKVFDKVDRKSKSTFDNIGKFAKAGALAVGAFGAAASVGIGKAITVASDFEETASKFGVVFDDVSAKAEQVAEDLQTNFGLSGLAARRLLGDTGDLLTGFGIAGDTALEMSESVNKLAVDLASFTNASGGAEAVSSALTKALLGERESLKTYGIAILEADVQAKLLEMGMANLTGEALRQAKAQATLQIAMEQSKNAIGDFERTQDSFANQSRIVKARLEDIGVELGQVFLPFATEAVTKIADFVSGLRGFTSEGGAAAEIFTIMRDNASQAFEFIGSALTSTFNLVREIFEENKEFIFDTFSGLASNVQSVFNLIGSVVKFFKKLWDSNFLGVQDQVRTTVSFLKFFSTVAIETFGGIADTLSFLFNTWEFTWEAIKLTTFNAINGMIGLIENFINSIIDGVNSILPEFAKLERVDLGKFKIDTEINEARVAALTPQQSLGEILSERGERLENAGVRLFEDLKRIEDLKVQREAEKAARDEEFLRQFRENQNVNIEQNTVNNVTLADDATIAEYTRRQQEAERDQLLQTGVFTS